MSNFGGRITFRDVPSPTNCVPFDRTRPSSLEKSGLHAVRGVKAPAEGLTDTFDHLSPAQYAFLSGVLAILAEHGEEALPRSCQMVIERFGRGHAG